MRKRQEPNDTPALVSAPCIRRPQTAGRIRGPRREVSGGALAAWLVLGLAGCSTPGPLHLYSIAPGAEEVHDLAVAANDATQPTPSYLDPGDVLTGFAYDPFTDHFFLRLAPGNHIRVVDRPARKIKREFDIEGGPDDVARGGGDLAVSPRDGHLFLVDPGTPELIETTRLAKFVRRVPLQGRTAPAAALAFDPERSRLLVLGADGRTIEAYTTAGQKLDTVTLAERVQPSLAFDPVGREFYAPLVPTGEATPATSTATPRADRAETGAPRPVGVFDAEGHLVRTLTIAPGDAFIDVGPHSFLRVF